MLSGWGVVPCALRGKLPAMCSRLRTRLDEITSDIERYPLETQSERIRELAEVEPHSVVCLQPSVPLRGYNCVMHAFDLVGKMTEYHPWELAHAPPRYVNHLIHSRVLIPCQPQAGALITWSTAEGLKHVGKLTAPDRAESKWGRGILCQHGLEELPVRFGDQSGFYSSIGPEAALEHLRRFHAAERRAFEAASPQSGHC